METITHQGHTYEIVDSVPLGYSIWNIGKNMLDGYLPLCQPDYKKRARGDAPYAINADTLKAIPLEGAQVILAAIGGGENTIEEMEKYVMTHKSAEPGSWEHLQVQRMKKALPIMRTIKWP